METSAALLPATLVKGESIKGILDVGRSGTRTDLLLAATRELTALLGERGSCILLDDRPRIALAPSEPATAGRSVELGRHPEIARAVRTGEIVAMEDGSSFAVPLFSDGDCLGVILVKSDRPHRVPGVSWATAALVARLTAALLSAAAASEPAARARSAPRRPTPLAIPASRPGGARRQILVIDDDPDIAATLGEAFEDDGYLVLQARDGREGVVRALSTRPDLILLDVNLPSLDGFAAAAELREASTTRDTPIIFISARQDLFARVRLLKLENVDFLPKPFTDGELLTRMDQAFIAARARQRLAHRAAVDELTGLGNLRSFRARLAEEHRRFSRYGDPLSLAMIDVDKLKAVNDQHGHAAGSDALRAIGEVLRREARTTDLAARIGGDEMAVLLPHTALAEASVFAERVRSEIARLTVHGFHVTVSIGVASLSRPGSAETDEQLLARADAAAYAAKRGGGDKTCVDGDT